MKKHILLIIIVFLFSPLYNFATHVVGGSLSYEQLGGSTYRITLKVYRDCLPGSAGFDANVTIEVKQANGTAFSPSKNIVIPVGTIRKLDPTVDTCVVKPNICVEEALYTAVVTNFPPQAGGYHLFWQRCCRNGSILNIVAPLNAGESFYTFIPDNNLVISNSSPSWINSPPTFVCQGQPIAFNHGATDADGDSLVYSFYNPYLGCSAAPVQSPNCPVDYPTFPGNVATFNSVVWNSGYSANNPLGGAALTLSSTGYLNGIPPAIGQYVMGVKCEEWRNGVKIGEIIRDFQFNVVNCPPPSVANYNTTGYCQGLSITFNNSTTPPANSYFWNFGDPTTLADTSHATSPTYTYPALGTYNVTLITNKGTACADTVVYNVSLPLITANFTSNTPSCTGYTVNFTDSSIVSNSSSITNWNWNFGNGNTSTQQNPSTTYPTSGTYNVTLIVTTIEGCKDTIVKQIIIDPTPIANAGPDFTICDNNPSDTLNGSVINATGGFWIGNGTFSPNNTTLNAIYTSPPSSIITGADTLYLVTTGTSICPPDTDMVIITYYPGPIVDAGGPITLCKDTSNIFITANVAVATGGIWSTSGTGYFQDSSQVTTFYYPSTADTAAGTVTLYLNTTGNGQCLGARDSIVITFTPIVIVNITSNDSICEPNSLVIGANSTTGSGIWTTSGSGTFSSSNTVLNGSYNPSAADNAAGSVQLIFTSTNNGGCQARKDTLDVTINPKPNAVFTSTPKCALTPFTFNNTSSIATGSITGWNWDFGDGTSNSSSQSPTHYFTPGGTYNVTLIVISDAGCIDTVTNSVTVHHKPNANFDAIGICKVDGTMFYDSSTVIGANLVSWNWAFGDNSTSTNQNPMHFYPSNGNYNVTLIVTSSQGCIDTLTQNIGIVNNPIANFTSTPPVANVNQNVFFSDLTSGAPVAWFWDFGDSKSDSTSTLQNPTHFYVIGGYYTVCLIATDSSGCTDTICKPQIVSIPPDIPTGFSPNGDGVNDVFYVYGGPFKKMNLKIYNNWGELIFETNNQKEGWNGQRGGVDQPIGVYVYTATATDEHGKDHVLHGDVTLLR